MVDEAVDHETGLKENKILVLVLYIKQSIIRFKIFLLNKQHNTVIWRR